MCKCVHCSSTGNSSAESLSSEIALPVVCHTQGHHPATRAGEVDLYVLTVKLSQLRENTSYKKRMYSLVTYL